MARHGLLFPGRHTLVAYICWHGVSGELLNMMLKQTGMFLLVSSNAERGYNYIETVKAKNTKMNPQSFNVSLYLASWPWW